MYRPTDLFDAVRRGPDQFDLFVDVVTHGHIKSFQVVSGEHIWLGRRGLATSPRCSGLSCRASFRERRRYRIAVACPALAKNGSVATFRFCRKTPRFRDFADPEYFKHLTGRNPSPGLCLNSQVPQARRFREFRAKFKAALNDDEACNASCR